MRMLILALALGATLVGHALAAGTARANLPDAQRPTLSAQPAPRAAQAAQAGPLEVSLGLDRRAYQPGAPISFSVRVRNAGLQAVTVTFPTAQRFDLFLEADGLQIDRWSRSRTFLPVVGEERFPPGQTVTLAGQWQPRTTLLPTQVNAPEEAPVTQGVYTIRAELLGIGVRVNSQAERVVFGTPRPLPAGCSNLSGPFALDLPASVVAGFIEPAEALKSLWQPLPGVRVYAGYATHAATAQANDLQVVTRLYPLTICLAAPGQVTLP